MSITAKTKQGNKRYIPDRPVVGVTLNKDVFLQCPVCGMSCAIELRQTADGEVRNQPRCSQCRHASKERFLRRTIAQ